MGRLVIALDAGVGVKPVALAAAWDADEEARTVGMAAAETAARGDLLPDVLTLVAIPLAVNITSTAVTALVGRLVAALRDARPEQPDVEVMELNNADGDRIVVVSVREARP